MTFPVYVRLGTLAVHPHVVFDVLAYATGLWLLILLRRRHTDIVDPAVRRWIVVAGLVGGVIGSHMLFAIENPVALPALAADPMRILEGKTIIGGLLGGLVAVEFVKVRLGVTVATGDLLVLPIAIGLAVGRVGCFLTGLDDGTSGTPTTLPWALDFGDGISRHPTQLYEIAFLLLLSGFIVKRSTHFRQAGDVFKVFVLGYLSFRALADFLKPAPRIAGISVLQWVCLAVIAYYAPHVPRLIREVRT